MIGRIATADEITAQFKMAYQVVNTKMGPEGQMTQLFLDFETCNDTIGANCYCQRPSTLEPTARTYNMATSLLASTCRMTVPGHTCSQVSNICASYIKKLSLFPQRHVKGMKIKNFCLSICTQIFSNVYSWRGVQYWDNS